MSKRLEIESNRILSVFHDNSRTIPFCLFHSYFLCCTFVCFLIYIKLKKYTQIIILKLLIIKFYNEAK